MTFRRKLLAVFALTVSLSVAAVALLVLAVTRNVFEKTEDQRTTALVTQFQREFSRRVRMWRGGWKASPHPIRSAGWRRI